MNLQKYLTVWIIILAFSYSGKSQNIVYKTGKDSIIIDKLNPPKPILNNPNTPYWKSFWEYGDGHYSFDTTRHVYRFSDESEKEVRVILTPHYSYSSTKTLIDTVTPGRRSTTLKKYILPDYKLVHIESSARKELVPENEIRVVVHYKMPPNLNTEEGYLFIFYNNIQEQKDYNLNFSPFRSDTIPGRDRLYGATNSDMFDFKSESWVGRESVTSRLVDRIASEYADVKVLKCSIKKGQEKRAFFSLLSAPELNLKVLGEKENLTVHIRALWVPKGKTYDATAMTSKYEFKMLSVHDPNELKILKPRGKPTYHSKIPELFEFEVHFENKGGRAAKNVDIKIPWPKNLNYKTIQVQERDPPLNDKCPICPPHINLKTYKDACFMVDTSQVNQENINDTIIFRYRNIGLMGKREPGLNDKKYTKGSIRFTVKSNGKMIGIQKAKAVIVLEGDNPLHTKQKKKYWRHKSLNLRGGKTLTAAAENFQFNGDKLSRYYNVGLSYINAPLFSSFGYRLELSSSGIGLTGRNANDFNNEQTAILTRETIDLKTIELQLFFEKRIKNLLAVGAGIGPSLPFTGQGIIESREISDASSYANFLPEDVIGSSEIFEAFYLEEGTSFPSETSSFGIMDNLDNNTFISKRKIGLVGSVFLEIGFLSKYGLGIRSNYRIIPNSYKEQCIKIRNAEVYLRFSLSTIN